MSAADGLGSLDQLYESRFPARERRRKHLMWAEIGAWLQRYIDADAPVLDIACDAGYFIANVRASERWATDLRNMATVLPDDVRFVQESGLELAGRLPAAHFGTVFMSNYLEHLAHRQQVVDQLRVCLDLLAPKGRVIVLQPNIRFTGPAYWDFIDHHVALTERSLTEAGEMAGLRTVELIPRFLPYTTKGRLPADRRLVRWYLRIRPAWRLLGQQTLYVAERAA